MGRVWNFCVAFRLDLLAITLLCLTYPIYFYKLGQSSLISWDEAWYAEVARNIIKNGDFLRLTFNGGGYSDHPPFGFWLIALGFRVFGVSDFWARFVPALCGFLTMPVVYLLGRELFGRIVGFASAVSLISSIWFIYRARSGNLDTILTFFFMLTLFFAVKASKDSRFLIPFSLSFSFLTLTKTLVPFTVLPVLGLIFWRAEIFRGMRIGGMLRLFFLPALIIGSIVGLWFFLRILADSGFVRRFFLIGLPGVNIKTDYYQNFLLMREYLHSSVGRWFWPGIVGLSLNLLVAYFTRQRKFLFMSIFFVSFFLPFMLSNKGHIWHLVPLAPVMILGCFSFMGYVLQSLMGFGMIHKIGGVLGSDRGMVINCAILSACFYITFFQTRQMWYQFIDIPAYVSDEAILSREAGKYADRFYIDGGDFTPAAVFYSGKTVTKIWEGGLFPLFDEEQSFVLITHQWRLDQAKIFSARYRILKSDRDKILIRKI